MGSGLLGLPYAFKQSGVLAGTLLMIIIGCMALHTMVLLVKCKIKAVSMGHDVVTFGDLAQLTLGKVGMMAVNIFLIFTQIGFCCAYVVYIGQNTKILLDVDWPWEVFALVWLVVLVLLSWIRTLKNVAPISTVANVMIGFGVLVIFTASLMSLAKKSKQGIPLNVNWFVDWSNLPSMMGIAIYSFEGIGFVLPSQTVAKKQESFIKILTSCIILIASVYLVFGAFGYIGFGSNTQEQILENLISTFGHQRAWRVLIKVLTVALIFAITATYPLQLFVATDILEEKIFDLSTKSKKTYWLQNNFRAFLVILTAFIAISVPKFGLLIGLIGSLGSASLQFIFPSLIWLKLFWSDKRYYLKVLLVFYTCAGIGVGVWGTYRNISDLVAYYQKK